MKEGHGRVATSEYSNPMPLWLQIGAIIIVSVVVGLITLGTILLFV